MRRSSGPPLLSCHLSVLALLLLVGCAGPGKGAAEGDSGACFEFPYYADADGDGYGDADEEVWACDAPDGMVSNAMDCDDTRADLHEGDYWYTDADNDGYGDPASQDYACVAPPGAVTDDSDCDDTRADVCPGAAEVCRDGVVNDCDDRHGAAAADLCSTFSLADADTTLTGESRYDHAKGVSTAGDGDGDGVEDILVETALGASGTVYVVTSFGGGLVNLSVASGKIDGESSDEAALSMAVSAGDLDGDGFADVLIGTRWADRAYMVNGPVVGEVQVADADTWILSDDDDQTGTSVAGVGDVDGDGLSDVLVGSPMADGPDVESTAGDCATDSWGHGILAGAARLFLGPAGGTIDVSDADATLWGEDAEDDAGRQVSAAGDLDGDGFSDLYLSAPANCEAAGAAYVVLGPVLGDVNLADSDVRFRSEVEDAAVGDALAGAGDSDGDGTPDLLVGAPNLEVGGDIQCGAVYLFLGPRSATWSVSQADATFYGSKDAFAGSSIASAGDIDADGFGDLIIGAPGITSPLGVSDAGVAYIVYGPVYGTVELLTQADARYFGDAEDDYGGYSVAGGLDVDSDGLSDVLVAAPNDDAGGRDAGAAFVLLGGGVLAREHGGI